MSLKTETDPRPGIAMTQGRKTLNSLQVMRGLAALAVVFYHAQLIMAKPEYGGFVVLSGIATKGWLGVNFFFVLSGFIILYAHWADCGQPARLTGYLWKRFSRVYPIYWVVLTGYIASALAGLGAINFKLAAPDLITSYLLIPLTFAPSLPLRVAWTLLFEVAFYLVFAVFVINRRAGYAVALLWFSATVINSLVLGRTELDYLNVWSLYFAGGVAVFFLFRKTPRQLGWPLFIGGCLTLLAMLVGGVAANRVSDAQVQPFYLLALILPFFLILLGALTLEREKTWQAPRALMLLGNASYAVYLVHSPVISVMAKFDRMLAAHGVPAIVLYGLIVVVATTAGIVAHLVLEQPLLAVLRRWPKQRSTPRPASLSREGA